MISKKWAFRLLLASMVLMASSALANASEVTTINYAFWGNPVAIGVEKDIIDEFEETHPNIKVNPIVSDYSTYHSKLLTLYAGGQAPDVMRIDSYFMADFMKNKALKDITHLIAKDKLNMNAYYPIGLFDCMKGKKYYGLPWGTAPAYVFINVKMFKNAGIPLPSPGWKYEQFVQIARQLSKGEGINRQYGYGFGFSDLSNMFPFVWSGGGDIFDKSRKKFTLNKPEAYRKIQEMHQLVKDGICPDPAQFNTAGVLNRWFANNKVAMTLGSAAEILLLQNIEGVEFEVLPFPGTTQYPRATITKSNIVAIASVTKKEKAAWEFLKFLRGPDQPGETLYMKAKRTPPSINDPKLWKLYADPNKYPKLVVESSSAIASKYGHVLPLRAGWNEIQGLLIAQLQRVFSGQLTAEKAMKTIAPKVQEIMDRNN